MTTYPRPSTNSPQSPAWLVWGAIAAGLLGLIISDRFPVIAWIGVAMAVVLLLAAIWFAAQCRSWVWLIVGILGAVIAAVAMLPVLFLLGAMYACAYQHACL
jgi:hypothetical protein